MSDRVFVYGTLMRGFDHPMSRRLHAGADLVGDGWCQGRLYLVAHYPGLLRSDDPNDIVHGEVVQLRDTESMLAALDDYEGVGPAQAQPDLYRREPVTVTFADGRVTEAWTYIYNRPVDPATRIASGRFRVR